MTKTRGFDITGLPGYRAEYDPRFGKWYVAVTGIRSFSWNDATERHDVPDYAENYYIEQRNTAKGAVAAAHSHARWVAEQMTKFAA